MRTLQEIFEFVKHAHQERLVKVNDYSFLVPYEWHLLRVMFRLGDNATYHEKALALLHDVLEDTNVTKEELLEFLQDPQLVNDVILCSDNYFPDHTKTSKMKMLAETGNIPVIRVKHADVYDNLGFERMFFLDKILYENYLKVPNHSKEKKFKRQLKDFPLLAQINSLVIENPETFGKPRSYPTYYDMLNILQSQEVNREFSKDILSGEFSDRLMMLKLFEFLTPNEKASYMDKQHLEKWHVQGTLNWLTSSTGQQYFGVEVPSSYFDEMNTYLNSLGLQEHIKNKLTRDDGHYHITIVNPKDMSFLYKNKIAYKETLNKFVGEEISIPFYGIGKASKDNNEAYFAVMIHPRFQQVRDSLGLTATQDFHSTLGFNEKDVFGVSKGLDSIICTPVALHANIYPECQVKLKKKF